MQERKPITAERLLTLSSDLGTKKMQKSYQVHLEQDFCMYYQYIDWTQKQLV